MAGTPMEKDELKIELLKLLKELGLTQNMSAETINNCLEDVIQQVTQAGGLSKADLKNPEVAKTLNTMLTLTMAAQNNDAARELLNGIMPDLQLLLQIKKGDQRRDNQSLDQLKILNELEKLEDMLIIAAAKQQENPEPDSSSKKDQQPEAIRFVLACLYTDGGAKVADIPGLVVAAGSHLAAFTPTSLAASSGKEPLEDMAESTGLIAAAISGAFPDMDAEKSSNLNPFKITPNPYNK